MIEFYMATGNGKGSAVQVKANGNSEVYFEMANQTPGTNQQTKSFDWKNKSFFGFNNQEISDIIDWFNWALTQGAEQEKKFPHLSSSQPKNIVFKFQNYNGKWQIVLSVFPANNNQNNNIPSKMFAFSIPQFKMLEKVLLGNLQNKLVSTGLYESIIVEAATNNVINKKIFLPKMNVGEQICSEKKDPNNHSLVIRDFKLINSVVYNSTTQQFIYLV